MSANGTETKRGKFIVFEGIDGCGKTTHAGLLCDYVAKKTGRDCLLEREPDSRDLIGAIIRTALYGGVKFLPETMAYLHVADRLEHIGYMLPLLTKGHNIVCDRYYISNMAYNAGESLNPRDIYELNRPCTEKLNPDAVIFLDVSPEETRARREAERTDRELYDAAEKQRRIRKNYIKALEIVESEGVRVFRIDASRAKEEVAADIRKAADTVFAD